MVEPAGRQSHAGHAHGRDPVNRWAGLEGWWVVAGILALLLLGLMKLVLFS